MRRINLMHLTDTLDAGGLERVAVNLANLMPRDQCSTHLCTTRRDGMLDSLVAQDVGRLRLGRRRRFDVGSVRRLQAYIRENQIELLHAHGTSLFIARAVSLLPPYPAVVWHDHYGRYKFDDRPTWLYRLVARGIGGVIAVNEQLAEWSRSRLRIPERRVWYIPNFICETGQVADLPELPGTSGSRIVCVANFRPEKDHPNLLRAMASVIRIVPSAHLLLVGMSNDPAYVSFVKTQVEDLKLGEHVSLLGAQENVPAILRACDLGVLSSASEGLPLSLLEYGMAGLPSIATQVGQCPEVLDDGVGRLVPPASPDELAGAILSLLRHPEERAALGVRFRERVTKVYSSGPVIRQVSEVYQAVLTSRPGLG